MKKLLLLAGLIGATTVGITSLASEPESTHNALTLTVENITVSDAMLDKTTLISTTHLQATTPLDLNTLMLRENILINNEQYNYGAIDGELIIIDEYTCTYIMEYEIDAQFDGEINIEISYTDYVDTWTFNFDTEVAPFEGNIYPVDLDYTLGTTENLLTFDYLTIDNNKAKLYYTPNDSSLFEHNITFVGMDNFGNAVTVSGNNWYQANRGGYIGLSGIADDATSVTLHLYIANHTVDIIELPKFVDTFEINLQ
ncbi:MAG: hypothetical protein ATN35_05425 [Epulopiscium sp. Nele67-Bin004]|nr:MAG: hypothetical protein ATN35_05425 [Epulopiscium sp. Nele67-Bin004]